MLFEVFFLFLILLFVIYFTLIYPEKCVYHALRSQGIPGEAFVPFIGQIRQLKKYRDNDRIMDFYENLVRKHGSTLLFCFGPSLRLMVLDPDIIADVLSRQNARFYTKPFITATVFTPIIGWRNLLVLEGREHERARRMINPAFNHQNLKSMISIITDQTTRTIDSIQSNSTVDLQRFFNTLTLSIIVSSAFGSDLQTNPKTRTIMTTKFNEVLQAIIYRSLLTVNQVSFLSKLPFWKKDILDNGHRLISKFVDEIILDRRQDRSTSLSNGPDLLDLLLSAVDDQGQPFTDEEINHEALAFVLAGSETTGNLMVWLFHILMTHEHVLRACQEEVDRVLPNGIEPTNEHLSDLVICEAVINETLRLYPPAPIFVRRCVREHSVGTKNKIRLPVGTNVMINSHLLHRQPELWPRPLEFDYTRWLRDPKTGLKPKLAHPFAYLPFAAGPRNCIGQNFALLEAKLMLAMFIQRCRFTLVPGQKIAADLQITLRTKYGLLAQIDKHE